jgi:menaquinone-dependent protoporphyrinogen oxidase
VVFSVEMPGALRGPLRALAQTEAPKVIAGVWKTIRPRDHRLFSGAVRSEQLSARGRVVFRASRGGYGDFRDWNEIDDRADGIDRELSAAETGTPAR